MTSSPKHPNKSPSDFPASQPARSQPRFSAPGSTPSTNKWWILIAISTAIFMSATNSTTMNLALPTLLRELDTTFAAIQWVVLSYLISMAVLLPSIGRWGDLIGRKRVFMQGQLLFIIGAGFCAGASNIYWLVGFRIVQAAGSAMMMGIGIAIITETWPSKQRGMALGIASGCIASGAVAGPLIGGFLLEALSWRWLFLFNIPIGLFSLLVVWRVVPNLLPTNQGERFDVAGALTIGGALLCFSLALTVGQDIGYSSPWITGLVLATVLCMAAFITLERRVSYPMVDLALFQDTGFTVNLLSALIIFAAVSGAMVVIPFYLEFVMGVSQRMMGILMAVLPLAYVAATPIAGIVSDRIGTRPMIGLGLGLACFSLVLAAQLDMESSAWQFILSLLPLGIGMGAFNTPNTSAIMGYAPKSQLGVVSSLMSETRTLGQATGVAVLGSFFVFRLQQYAGAGITVDRAATPHIVQAMQDDFLIAALVMLICLIGVSWTWRGSSEVVAMEAGD
ncbi:MAG: DHA2 family efflux MFS transporter permease subunit [Chloroflexota bacterium]